jgi:predicted DNA-binding transcriptional regulator YafY
MIWPIATAFYVDVTVVAAWCELRGAFRHFRTDGQLRGRVPGPRQLLAERPVMQSIWLKVRPKTQAAPRHEP